MKYPLICDTWNDTELASIQKVVRSNRFSMFEEVSTFESEFASFFNSKYAVCVNSGSSANMIAIAAMFFYSELKRGDEIIVPSVGWSTTYAPLFYLGLKPVFVDIDFNTLNIDTNKIEEKINEKTKAILTVNLLGCPSNFDMLNSLAKKYDLMLLEDNCESMGAMHDNKFCGTYGIGGTFSFFYSHHITTIEGGMILTDDFEFYNICISLRSHGWLRGVDEKSKIYDDSYSDDFRKMFWFVLPGFNVRPTEFTGAIGKDQLKKFPQFLKQRKSNFKYFSEKISKIEGIRTQEFSEGNSSFSFALYSEVDADSKEKFLQLKRLIKETDIEFRPIASGNITRHPMMKHMHTDQVKQVISDHVDTYGFMVGNHPVCIKDRIDYLIDKIKTLYK